MEHMIGVEMGDIWDDLQLTQKRRLAQDLVDMYHQLSRLKADCCGSIYHSVESVDDCNLGARSPRWKPLSAQSLHLLRSHCSHSIANGYTIGPLNEISLLDYRLSVPSPSETFPTFTSDDYVQLVAYNGKPTTRSDYDLPTREKCVELFGSIHRLYSQSSMFGPDADRTNFRFSHGDLHEGNILIDPRTGAITGIIDWEAAAFRPLWGEICGVGWFKEDRERFIFGSADPGNFEDDNNPEDEQLRAFFRTELYKRNSDLFASFLRGSELRAVVHAAADEPRPIGETNIFLLDRYHRLGYWNEERRGRFPWDMETWQRMRRKI
jgi:Phosphotransferase enzyme family